MPDLLTTLTNTTLSDIMTSLPSDTITLPVTLVYTSLVVAGSALSIMYLNQHRNAQRREDRLISLVQGQNAREEELLGVVQEVTEELSELKYELLAQDDEGDSEDEEGDDSEGSEEELESQKKGRQGPK